MTQESYQERVARVQRERAKRQKQVLIGKIIGTALLVAGLVALLCVAFIASAFVFANVTWNVGVVGLAAALGASVSKISFTTGLGAVFVSASIKELLRGKPMAQSVEEIRARRK